jgi:hypothetical protein
MVLRRLMYFSFLEISATSFSRSSFEVTSHSPALLPSVSPLSCLSQFTRRKTGRFELLRYYLTPVLRTVSLCRILKDFHAAAGDIDFGP